METEIPPKWDDQSQRDICLFIHTAVSGWCHPEGRETSPQIYCYGEMKKLITFLSGSSAFIHAMTWKENMPHFGEKKHANNSIECKIV